MGKRHCLLVVDDEPEVVHSLQDLLRFDYRVLGATRAADGLKLADREPVHIVMSDQRMPEMSGVEFLRHMREDHPDVVRLLFTGYADIKAVIDAINQGHVFRYIMKPWDVDELQAVLRQSAERFDLYAERKQLLTELQAKNEALRQANELKDMFIKVANHELRTPLTIVLGLADLARQTEGVPEPLHGWLEQVYAGSQRLHRLIEQMGKQLLAGTFDRPVVRQPVDLAALLRSAADEMMPFIRQRHQTLEVDAAPDLGTMALEPDKLRDSVEHLILNGIKFTPDGGSIRVTGRRLPGGGAEVRVTDTGMGIEPASLQRLFQPFFTGFDVSRHRSGVFEYDRRGLGLGLSLVKAFIERLGGQISVESQVGRGTTFIITLPPGEPGEAPASPSPGPAPER